MQNNTQLAEAKPQETRSLKGLLNSKAMREQFALALPRHLSADRFVRIATTALMRVKNLDQCTPESFMKCLLDLSSYGIEPDGRRAHLIPFKNNRAGTYECTLILDWKGLAELALRSGMIAKLHADLVCENDDFAFDCGDILHHKINFRQERGEPYAAYAMAITKTGERFVQVMTRAEIERIRNGSQGYKSAMQYNKDSPWTTDPGEMWKKTAFRRLAKWLPLSAEFRDALDKEDEEAPTMREIPAASIPLFAAPVEPQALPVAKDSAAIHIVLAEKMAEAGLSWYQVERVAIEGGILDVPVTPALLPTELATEILAAWPNLEPLAKGVEA